jgi:DnaK suppressor protein
MTERNHMNNRERYDVLKAMLEERRRDIHDRLRSLRETLPAQVAEVKDAEEQSVHDFVQDVELALMEMKAETLGQIDEAIRRLEEGTYGTCAQCNREISEARLKAVPFATLCLECQESEEEARAVHREGRPASPFASSLGSLKVEGEL